LARRESPSRGSRHLSTALALVRQMPHTLAALESGVISEWRAELVVRETAMLTGEQRTDVDTELATTLGDELGRLGDRELVRRVQAIAYRIDAASVVARSRAAEAQRRVSIRPAPDTMAYVTALLPVAQGVAVHAALTTAAGAARAAGDDRTKGQVMADMFVQCVTGQAEAPLVPVEVQVVMTERALLHGDDTRRTSRATALCLQPGPAACSRATPTSRPRPRSGCGGSTRIPPVALWWRWTRAAGSSTAAFVGCWSPATAPAAPRGAARRSPIWTTSPTTPTMGRRPPPTGRGSACGATTPNS